MAAIDELLTNLNEGYSSITTFVANKFNFTDESGNPSWFNAINDGGIDMYDGGNLINTNLTHSYDSSKNNASLNFTTPTRWNVIPYTHTQHTSVTFNFIGDGTVDDGTSYFGAGSEYFTNLYPGMFVLAARNINITEFHVTGNIGTDGGGLIATDDFTITVAGNEYAVYRKSVYNSPDPSINHIFIIPGNGSGVTHTWDTTRQCDDDAIQNLTGIDAIYYLLLAKSVFPSSAAALSHGEAVNVVTQFLTIVNDSEDSIDMPCTATASISARATWVATAISNSTTQVTVNGNRNTPAELDAIECESDVTVTYNKLVPSDEITVESEVEIEAEGELVKEFAVSITCGIEVETIVPEFEMQCTTTVICDAARIPFCGIKCTSDNVSDALLYRKGVVPAITVCATNYRNVRKNGVIWKPWLHEKFRDSVEE